MVLSASAADGVLVEHAQPRHGFSGIENSRLGACNRIHELPGQGSDSAEALQKIQDHPFAGKNHAGVMPDHRHRLALVQPDPIENLRMRCDFVMRSNRAIKHRVYVENAGNTTDAGQDTILLCHDRRCSPLVRVD